MKSTVSATNYCISPHRPGREPSETQTPLFRLQNSLQLSQALPGDAKPSDRPRRQKGGAQVLLFPGHTASTKGSSSGPTCHQAPSRARSQRAAPTIRTVSRPHQRSQARAGQSLQARSKSLSRYLLLCSLCLCESLALLVLFSKNGPLGTNLAPKLVLTMMQV